MAGTGTTPISPEFPAGQSTGGQWIHAGNNAGAGPARKFVRDTSGEESWNFFFNTFRPDGSLAEQVVFNRDRSRIVSEFSGPGGAEDWDERHTVFLPDGSKFTFENSGDTQTIYDADGQTISAAVWTNNGAGATALGATRVPAAGCCSCGRPRHGGRLRRADRRLHHSRAWLCTRGCRAATGRTARQSSRSRPRNIGRRRTRKERSRLPGSAA